MIFDPNHGVPKVEKKTVAAGAIEEFSQGKKISNKANELYASENEELHLEAKDTLQSMGRELLGYARELQGQSLLLSALVAAIEVGAYKRVAKDLRTESSNGETKEMETITFPLTIPLADVSDVLSKLLTECDSLTSYAQTYAERHLELSKSDTECGPGLANNGIDEYIKQNLSRPIEEVESDTRWLVDNFERIMGDLGSQLDALVGFLDKIKANENNFILQLLRCEPSREWTDTSKLIAADQNARDQLLQRSLALQSTIQDESPTSLIAPIMKLREALLADTPE